MKSLIAFAVTILGLAASPAFAADDCQIDLLLGGVFGQSQHIHSSATPITDKFDLKGPAAGAGFGCTWHRNRWATGVLADFMHTTGKGHSQDRAPFNTNFTSSTELDWLAALRLLIGYRSSPGSMLYVTGGAAAAPIKATVCPLGATGGSSCAIESQTLYGLVGGIGAQWQFARHWSVKGEYLVFGFEKRAYLNPPPAGFADRGGSLEPEVQLARIGLSFHF
jgi:opacity protein-like surface antigen